MARRNIGDLNRDVAREAWDDGSSLEDVPEGPISRQDKARRCCKSCCIHVGLFAIVALYCVGGAYMFKAIEGAGEIRRVEGSANKSTEIEQFRSQMKDELWKNRNDVNYSGNVDSMVKVFQDKVSSAAKDDSYKGVVWTVADSNLGWSFLSGLLFCVTIVTTIGYGHVAPVTWEGQLVCIFYCLVGIPLMLMFLANIGEVMANVFRIAYGRGCCYFCWRKRKQNYEYNKQMVVKAKERGDNKSAWDSSRRSSRSRSRSVSPSEESGTKKKKSKRRDSDEIDWEFLRTIDPDTIICPEEDIVNVPITLTLVVIAVYVFVGAVIFAALEEWSWIKGAYFSFVTLSTIGFGDLVPGWHDMNTTAGVFKLIASLIYIILGLAVLSMSFNLMMEEMLAKFRWVGYKLGIVDDPEQKAKDDAVEAEIQEEIAKEEYKRDAEADYD